jgi:molybdopterin molybdotransferase
VPKSVWQLAGAGAVGAQALTGVPVLARLRDAHPGRVAVWPFEDCGAAEVVLAEVYPSLLGDVVAQDVVQGVVPDEAQVRRLARALWELSQDGALAALMAGPPEPEEGRILGAGHGPVLRAAAVAPRLRNDCFALPPGVAWMAVDEALGRLRAALIPVAGEEAVPLGDAAGRVLAQAAVAARAHPPAANAAVDGWAFAHPGGEGPLRLPIAAGRAAAGTPLAGRVPAGHALRILTGALLPEGVDTVALQEDCAAEGGHVALGGGLRRGANTRAAGEDVGAGAPLLPAGHRLRPPDLALLAATGLARVAVRRRLRVAVLSTGDEVVPPGPAAPHQVFDANRPMLLALAAGWGHVGFDLGHAPDDPGAIRAALDRGAAGADAIVTSGGASAGDEDHVARLLQAEGRMTAWRIAVKPGRPLALATWRGVPVFGLPGNPVAAMVCALVFARPALSVLAGGRWEEPAAFTVPAAFARRKKAGRREYLRARLDAQGRAEAFASEGSGRVSGLVWATGLIELPEAAGAVAPGDPVRFLPYAGFGM